MKSNLIYSVLGVVFKTLFPIIIYPYITRVLGVANLGEYNFYASTVAYLSLFSTFGISLYGTKEIGRLKDDKKAYSQVFGELVTINIIMSAAVYLFIFVLILFSDSYQNVTLFLITSITIVENAIGAEYLFVALEKQKFMLLRNICFKILSLILIFMFVLDKDDLIAYAVIMLISTAGVSITNILTYKNKIDWKSIRVSDFHLLVYFAPLLQVFIMDVMIHYYGMMDIVILGNLDTVESVGFYSVASKIYALTYAFLASTAVPLLPRAAYYVDNGMENEYNSMVSRCYDIYLLIVTISAFILYYFAEDIVELISGEEFRHGYKALRYFAPTLFFSSFCNFFIFEVFYPKKQGKLVLLALLVSILMNLIFSYILIPALSYVGCAIAFLVSYIVLFLVFVFIGRKYLPKFSGYNDFMKEIIGVVFCLILCMQLSKTDIHFLFQLILCGFVFVMTQLILQNATTMYFVRLVKNKINHA
jgi:O-antigen/teichoic acid export membrane protein